MPAVFGPCPFPCLDVFSSQFAKEILRYRMTGGFKDGVDAVLGAIFELAYDGWGHTQEQRVTSCYVRVVFWYSFGPILK